MYALCPGSQHNAELAEQGKARYETGLFCLSRCRTVRAWQALGAPNLTDKVWLYGSSEAKIVETDPQLDVMNQMPAWKDFLGDAKIHLLSAYVLGLSSGGAK
jgi:cytochrome c oxidase cbb3-type subunit 3